MDYYFSTTLQHTSMEEAVEKITQALKEEGFGILTEIDLNATFKKKLDVDFPNYKILGACNPNFAHKALQAENKIGTMLPCNVIVRENEDGSIEVAAVDPMASMMAIKNESLGQIANEVREMLARAIDKL
ncbi:DUF302 domain-containing protein [Flagellimonas beolgyonensis]|uniref:DUF302 domain-containing protein n=1 Tax=Flagellimonas beolgyonensis TaxID=864064 RepID=UPI003D65435C